MISITESYDATISQATSAQINYAKFLGIQITGTETVFEMSEKISSVLDPSHTIIANENCVSYAHAFGVGRSVGCTRDEVLWRITRSVAVNGRGFDLARWYIFRVYHSLSDAWSDKSLTLTLDGHLAEMADNILQDRQCMNGIMREAKRCNFDRFSATRPLDEHGAHRVATTRTIAYKHVSEILRAFGYTK